MKTRNNRSKGTPYFAIKGAPGEFFRCIPYATPLSVTGCAERWRIAQKAKGDLAPMFEKCRACPVGAAYELPLPAEQGRGRHGSQSEGM